MSITAISYILIYSFGIIKSIAGKPIYGLYAYIFAFYFHAPSYWWGQSLPDIRWSLIAGFITLISVLLHAKRNSLVFWKYRENRMMLLLVFFVALQNIWAISSFYHQEYTFLILKFLLLIFIIQNVIKTQDDLKGFILVNILGCAYLAYEGFTMHHGGRFEGTGPSILRTANAFGQHLSTVLVFAAYLLLDKWNKLHYVLIAAIAFTLAGVFLTESRGVILSLLVLGIISIFYMPSQAKKKFFTLLILAIVSFLLLLGPQIVERFESMQTDEQTGEMSDKSAASRIVIIESQWEMFKQAPYLGHGNRGTLMLSPIYIPKKYHTPQGGRASHNFLMSLLVDHGAIGTALYLFILLSCIQRFRGYRKNMHKYSETTDQNLVYIYTGMTMALIFFIISGMFSSNKALEIQFWLVAIIPLIHVMMVNKTDNSQRHTNNVNRRKKANQQYKHQY